MRTTLIISIILCVLLVIPGWGQVPEKKDPLEDYIREGLENNLVLQQKNVSLDKALLALKTAKSMFLPAMDFQFSYQTADGGRTIPLPLGDLLNEAYATLNQLTGTQDFPPLQNETINFLPKDYYDTYIRTTVPIVNTDLFYNKKISRQQIVLREYELDIYRRELVKSIKSAFYNYLSAIRALEINQSSLQLAEEGKRVNEKLLENGKGLPAYVLRANSEIASVQARITDVRRQIDNARLLFNSLLNRPADSPVDTSFDVEGKLAGAYTQLNEETGITGREELKSVGQMIRLNETVVKMNRNYLVPKLNGFLNLGSQAEGWAFNDQSRYYLAGFRLELPLFAGNRNRQKIMQAQFDVTDARLNLEQVRQQLDVRVRVARNNLKAAWETYRSSQVQLEAAESYQRLIERGYRAGTNTYIETVDARDQLTAARMSLIIRKYQVLLASAELEREAASYQLERKPEHGDRNTEAGNLQDDPGIGRRKIVKN